MLNKNISVERRDLVPTAGLVIHGSGDKKPAIWLLYVRAPYVVQNGLACDIVLWASQPSEAEIRRAGGEEGLLRGRGKAVQRKLTFGKMG